MTMTKLRTKEKSQGTALLVSQFVTLVLYAWDLSADIYGISGNQCIFDKFCEA